MGLTTGKIFFTDYISHCGENKTSASSVGPFSFVVVYDKEKKPKKKWWQFLIKWWQLLSHLKGKG